MKKPGAELLLFLLCFFFINLDMLWGIYSSVNPTLEDVNPTLEDVNLRVCPAAASPLLI
jgi:hypothetical protein